MGRRSNNGSRYFEGRQLLLEERHVGLNAESNAKKHADRLRAEGKFVRRVKFGEYDHAVYAL